MQLGTRHGRLVLLLQAKKVRRVQSAFEMFNRMMQTPGKSELTLTELRVCLPLACMSHGLHQSPGCCCNGGQVLLNCMLIMCDCM